MHVQALRLVHRYLYVVEVLMEGCGWDTKIHYCVLQRLGGGEELSKVITEMIAKFSLHVCCLPLYSAC